MLSIFLLIPLSLMLFVIAIWAIRYAVKSNQFEDLDNAAQRIILDDRQERRQTIQDHEQIKTTQNNVNVSADSDVDSVEAIKTTADITTNDGTINKSDPKR